jgi:ubiquinone/menaquinone biosynthesis C-methylase UbiE
MAESTRTYLPAAGHDWALPLYDPIVKLLGGDKARRALLEQMALMQGMRVLDVGCGTGTLDVAIKRLYPDVVLTGIDPDPKALARARRKAGRSRLTIQFDQGFGDELPYATATFDRVFSSFMFHHLPQDVKGKTLRSVRQVLKHGGEFHMMDFEGPEDSQQGFVGRLLHSNAHLKDNSERDVLRFLRLAGFSEADKVGRRHMIFGNAAYYRAVAL